MKMINCQRCRRPFMFMGSKLCPECVEEENRAFDIIREYLDKYPQAGLYQIAADTGVDESIIISLVHKGRLKCVEKRLKHKCARCGAEVLIVEGDFCDRCRRELTAKVRKAVQELEWKTKPAAAQSHDSARHPQEPDSETDLTQLRMYIREIQRKREETR